MKLSTLVLGVYNVGLNLLTGEKALQPSVLETTKAVGVFRTILKHVEVHEVHVSAKVTLAGVNINYQYDVSLDDEKVAAFYEDISSIIDKLSEEEKAAMLEGFLAGVPAQLKEKLCPH